MLSRRTFRSILLFFFTTLIIFAVTESSFGASVESVSLDSSWRWSELSAISGGRAVLYRASDDAPIVAVNAGHGTSGGDSERTLCHPDGSPKIMTGTTKEGAVYSPAVSTGMTFPNGVPEADVVLALAKKIKNRLLARNISVLMLRDSPDVQLDNIARAVIANAVADAHIAIHFDATSNHKGAFFCSVPDDDSYTSMEPVASVWREHERLGESIISSLRRGGIKIYQDGRMPNDLTQTSYSTIPSVAVEFGDKASDISDRALDKLADAAVDGMIDFLGKAVKRRMTSTEGIYSFKVGRARVTMLSELQRDGSAEILIGATDEMIAKFAPGGKFANAVAAFAVELDGKLTLIDTGFGQNIADRLRAIGHTEDDVERVLITHAHRDHIGGLTKAGERIYKNAEVYISKMEFEKMNDARAALACYGDVVRIIEPGALESGGSSFGVEGWRAIASFGHTPGHTLFELTSDGHRVIFWGDIAHAMSVQMPHPEVAVTYDSDAVAAVKSRAAILEHIADSDIIAAGAHIPNPGVGRVLRDASNEGAYIFKYGGLADD